MAKRAPAPGGLRPEAEILLCSARVYLDASSAERIRDLLQQDIDWDYLLSTATAQGVMPLLHWHLNRDFQDALPKPFSRDLHHLFQRNALNNLYLTGELLKALNLWETHGIAAIAFKGPTLAASVYGSLALRQSGDLDILLRR